MDFDKDPKPVPAEYTESVRKQLKQSRVAYTGYFDEFGLFDLVCRGDSTGIDNSQRMWASNLLRYSIGEHGVRTNPDRGWLHVFNGRSRMRRGEKRPPIFTIDPANIRYVDTLYRFPRVVGESGWLIGQQALFLQRVKENLTPEQILEIVIKAEAGERPPYFDENLLVKVEPGAANKKVYVVNFWDIEDAVVVDRDSRQLIGRCVTKLLSASRWGEAQ